LPQRDVKLIESSVVLAIYESGYWIPPRCDLLEPQLDLVQFETAVNMSPGRAVSFLQEAVGCGVDGDFGPATERAIASCDPGSTIVKYCERRKKTTSPDESLKSYSSKRVTVGVNCGKETEYTSVVAAT